MLKQTKHKSAQSNADTSKNNIGNEKNTEWKVSVVVSDKNVEFSGNISTTQIQQKIRQISYQVIPWILAGLTAWGIPYIKYLPSPSTTSSPDQPLQE